MEQAWTTAAKRRAGVVAGILVFVAGITAPLDALAAGNISITKTIVHPAYGNSQSVTSTIQFTVLPACTGTLGWGAFQIKEGQTVGLYGSAMPVGASCSLTETLPSSFAGNCPVPLTWLPYTAPGWNMPPAGSTKNIVVTNTYKCSAPPGALTVKKLVSGPAGTTPPSTPFAMTVTCKDLLNVNTPYPLSVANNGTGTVANLVPGSQCQVTETPPPPFTSNGQTCTWNAPVYSPSPITIASGNNNVTVTNTYTCSGGSSVLKICKKAGSGIPVGMVFNFTVNGNPVNVPAGPASSGGYCNIGGTFPAGALVTIKETLSGALVQDITVRPADRQVALDVLGGIVDVKMGSGVTEATYTNERPTTGYLEICKRGTAPGNFSFTINPGGIGPIVVPQGACSPAIQVPAGQISITEAPASMSFMSSCATVPANRQVSCNLSTRTSVVNVPAGYISSQTIAFVTNKGFGTPPGPGPSGPTGPTPLP